MISIQNRLIEIEELIAGEQQHIEFLSPATATALAAAKCRGLPLMLQISEQVRSYAVTIGLDAVLNDQEPPRKPVLGRTYSPLAELARHDQVDASNAVINELISHQLADYPALASQACQLVGEIHNNVPAHAWGMGFSMAQYYPQDGLLEVAVADCGRGMLRNVQQHYPEIASHSQAIDWCMQEGHTTVTPADDWAQWIPHDATQDPYGSAVPDRDEANHHLGLGLWKLEQIVQVAGGDFVVWSGDARLRANPHTRVFDTALYWPGVVVVFRLPIVDDAAFERQSQLEELETLARRLEI